MYFVLFLAIIAILVMLFIISSQLRDLIDIFLDFERDFRRVNFIKPYRKKGKK